MKLSPISKSQSPVWFVTGCSTGFGRRICEMALKKGARVVVTARELRDIQDLGLFYPQTSICLRLDVTDHRSIELAVTQACSAFGGIDILVNNAGFAVQGAFEEVPDLWVRKQFETNFFGVLDVTRSILPIMRLQGSGKIFNLSSRAGRTAIPGMGIYSASKFAIEGFSEALSLELDAFGISVTLIEPGSYDTDFGHRSLISTEVLPQYADRHQERERVRLDSDTEFGDLDLAVQTMITLSEMTDPPLRVPLGPETWNEIVNKLESEIQSYEEIKPLWESTNFGELTHRVLPIRGKKTHASEAREANSPTWFFD